MKQFKVKTVYPKIEGKNYLREKKGQKEIVVGKFGSNNILASKKILVPEKYCF